MHGNSCWSIVWEPSDLPTDDVEDDAQEMPEAARTNVFDCTLADGHECGKLLARTMPCHFTRHACEAVRAAYCLLLHVSQWLTLVRCVDTCTSRRYPLKSTFDVTLRVGRCTGAGSSVVYKVAMPRKLRCPTCDEVCANLDGLLAHVVTHVQLPNPQGHQAVI